MMAYYSLIYFIVPQFFARRKYFKGILASLLLIVVYAVVDATWEMSILNECRECMEAVKEKQSAYYDYLQRGSLNVILTRITGLGITYQLLLLMALPVGIKISTAYLRQRVTTLQLAKENVELEFNFLKAQIHPHFLFNTLNNIYALILKNKKEQSAETVARLANFMRYSLYQDEKENTIGKEIQLLKDYIELEKIRLNHTLVNFNYEVDNASMAFPPLLFMPVVENAFKFCVEETGKVSWISIQLNLKNKNLHCKVSNTCKKNMPAKGGIGLENIQKRLNYYYADNYSFETKSGQHLFTVIININLSKK